ncbi:MAG: hypothetical protein EZS28_027229, partial [Streblomastix strix]
LKRALTSTGQDSGLWLTIAIFHMSFTKNRHKMGEALRSCKQNIPSMIERWMVYALLHDLEKVNAAASASKNGQSGGEGVAFRSKIARAQRAHDFAKAYLSQAYLFLSREHLDLERIMTYLDKAIISELEAHAIFDELMKEHGTTSVQLLRAYGSLLRDIYRDDDSALAMFNEANAIEEELAANSGHGRSAMAGAFYLQGKSKIVLQQDSIVKEVFR